MDALTTPVRHRIFLLSPANCSGKRAGWLLREGARFDLARRLQEGEAVQLGEIFTFVSGLYFRGKQAYARRFAAPPAGVNGVQVITPTRGLRSVDALVTPGELREYARVDIGLADARYRVPLERDIATLAAQCVDDCEVVLLGSIASNKYVEILLSVLGQRLRFPIDFVGRGDMSRGGLLLRCAESGMELPYSSLHNVARRGVRPPKLPPLQRDYA